MSSQGCLTYASRDVPDNDMPATVAGDEIVSVLAEGESIYVPICVKHRHFLAGHEAVQDYSGGMRACRDYAPIWTERQGENPSEVCLASPYARNDPVILQVPN